MELRRTATALLRSRSSPLTLITPSTPLRWQQSTRITQSSLRSIRNSHTKRHMATTAINYALRPSATTSTPNPSSEETPSENTPSTNSSAPVTWVNSTPRISSRGNNTNILRLELDADRERAFNGGFSDSDLLGAMNVARQSRSRGFNTDRMMDPKGPISSPASNADLLAGIQADVLGKKTARVPMRLNASTGRTVEVGPLGIDIARGIRLLEMSCARNRVRADANSQRFHERPGLKRKRLGRERWRRRFAEGFKGVVGRVKELKRQGW